MGGARQLAPPYVVMATTQHMRCLLYSASRLAIMSDAGNCTQQPVGLDAVYAACKKIYPEQPNPLQVTALVKYW